MKKIWIINQFANLPSGSRGTRHYSLAKYLKNENFDTSIIAGSIEHNTGFQKLKGNHKVKLDNIEGVKFFMIKLKSHRLNSLRGRILNMINFSIKILSLSPDRFLEKPNLIIGSSPSPLAALSGYLLAIKYKVPFIYEVRDLWPKTLIEMNVIKSYGFVNILLNLLDTFLAKKSTKVITLMQGAKEFYRAKGILDEKITWISNGVDFKEKMLFKTLENRKEFNLTYMGSMGPSNSIETILYAIKYVNKNLNNKFQVNLNLIGSGSRKEELIKLSNTLNLENVHFKKPIPKFKVHEILSSSDLLILAMNNLPGLYKYGISFNKIFDYLLSARPIIIASCANYDLIRNSNSGLISNAGDFTSLGQNIIKMINFSEEERSEYGNNGRKFVVENFLYADLAKKLSKLINECIAV